MKTRTHILAGILITISAAVLYFAHSSTTQQEMMAIQVFAGDDTDLCPGATLHLPDLDAYISGEVTNGYWFSSGDGRFLPGYTTSARFSTGVSYVPGVADNANGGFTLTLVSDDPDLDPITGTNGPKVQVSDQVRISFPPPPVLVCNNNLQVSLNFDCTILLDASALVANPKMPYDNYSVEMYDKNNKVIPGALLTKEHIKQNITFKVGHVCTNHYCWGTLQVSDYYPPIFTCKNDTISCMESPHPTDIGFPIPPSAVIDSFVNQKYYISNWDACSQVQLSYTDEIEKLNCSTPVYDRIITRRWNAKDVSQNLSLCVQTIRIEKAELGDIVFPPSFDDTQKPSFDCVDSFPTFPNGHPSTDTTGAPTGGSCLNLGILMTDIRFETCGNGYKLARSWFAIEWCTQESYTYNQIIIVKDKKGPAFICPEDITLGTGYYACATGQVLLPLPDSITDCSEYQLLLQLKNEDGDNVNQFLFFTNQKYYVNNLPLGDYTLTYILLDECSNTTQCEINITVVDVAPPIPVCDKTTVISVDLQGKARLFATSLDDGSWDNCGIQKYEIKRKEDECGNTLQWGLFADFCCKDVGKFRHVSLQVTDIHGLVNTCHVEVFVDDKIKPQITCPSHITISCDYGYNPENLNEFGKVALSPADRKPIILFDRINAGIVGQDGLATDNCSVTITHSRIVDVLCHKGTIKRTFTATDGGNFKDSCTQVITLRNPDLFSYDDIIWPDHYHGEGCKITDVDTSVSGTPKYLNTSCASVASYYEDQPFYLADSACLKIFRNWYVIDWCQFDQNTLEGRWGPYTQIIKVNNHTAPTILTGCRDTIICNYEENCGPTLASLLATGDDDCTEVSALSWSYRYDQNADSITDISANSSLFERKIPIGIHRLTRTLSDQCGNITTCTSRIEVRDCKKPSPYCISQVSMTLDENSFIAELWAKDMDLGGFDNCTDQDQLVFSFSQDTSDNVIYLGCEDLPNGREADVMLDVYITDLAGNQDYCSVSVHLTDNSDVCADSGVTGNIEGKIATTTGFTPENIQVEFWEKNHGEKNKVSTDTTGKFNIPGVSDEYEFVLKPFLKEFPAKGLSTLDLVLTQRHILGVKIFDSPYQYIAADVNGSRTLNSVDLVELRRVILGTKSNFPNNIPSWVFINKNEYFPLGPLGQKYQDSLVTIAPSSNNDFIAVKIGDVNLSFENELKGNNLGSRTTDDVFTYNILQVNEVQTISVFAERNLTIDGFQTGILIPKYFDPSSWKVQKEINSDNIQFHYAVIPYNEKEDLLRIVAYADEPLELVKNELLFSITCSAATVEKITRLDGEQTFSEVYINEKPHPLRLVKMSNKVSENAPFFTLMANPVSDIIRINFAHTDSDDIVIAKLIDISGKILLEQKITPENEEAGSFDIHIPDQTKPGIYLLKLDSGKTSKTFSIIKIE
ncbi:MAG: T9SS type A sorting domain-containing protein [Saprospiraceae bacterium]|nr:T9SS type A sorting domain-containing protein [Saprospiraceae bacterium]